MKNRLDIIHHPLARLLQHLAFWFFSFYIFLQVFKTGEQPEKIDYIYTLLFQLTLVPAVYLNLEFLLPRLANPRRWLYYILALAAVIFLFSWLNDRFFQQWSNKLLPDYIFISYFKYWEILLFFTGYIFISSLLKLSKSWFRVNDLERLLLISEKDKMQMELKALRSQIQPHFFFNTLNSIYAMSMEKDERLPATVLQLSDLMRYFLYQPPDGKVPLDTEIKMLRDYIALQRIRSDVNLELKHRFPEESNHLRMAPYLLITFLENAFKHGRRPGNVYVHLDLNLEGNRLNFKLENNMGEATGTEPDKANGLGLENVRRRLELLYPGKHQLKIESDDKKFFVDLYLEL